MNMAWLVGYPRDKVDWGPTIDPQKCVGCGMCINCGRKVFDWVEGQSVVARRLDCVVGCQTCANLCQGDAITFPDIKGIQDLYQREGIWAKVQDDLTAKGVID
jgi:NAD-dependent dihydropyrimidine dehydrogenase PreA subunit